jgi:hypothetical protein
MLRKRFGGFTLGIDLATLAMVGTATAQTTCRGYQTRVIFGEVCAWGCGPQVECNCVVGACADGTVVVI